MNPRQKKGDNEREVKMKGGPKERTKEKLKKPKFPNTLGELVLRETCGGRLQM